MIRNTSFGFSLLMACLMLGCGGATTHKDGEAEVVAAIVKLGGTVEYSDISPDKPVIKVYLNGTAVTDADLVMLQKLSRLQNLFLGKTQIGDAGLDHLRKSGQLRTISLNATAVTDAGLRSLIELKSLKTLNLQETKVTEAGVKELRKALPELTVAR